MDKTSGKNGGKNNDKGNGKKVVESPVAAHSADFNQDGKVTQQEQKRWEKAGRPIDQLDTEALGAKYGYAAAMISTFPQLGQILQDILKQGITDPGLQLAAIQNSDWYKGYTNHYLEVEKDRLSKDPAVWDAQIKSMAQKIKDQYLAAGATIDDATARDLADKYIHGASVKNADGTFTTYDDAWLSDMAAASIDFTKTKTVAGVQIYDLSGAAEANGQKLYKLAHDYGLNSSMSNGAFTSWFQKTLSSYMKGDISQEEIDDELVNAAMSRFPGLSQQLQRGLTLREAADPYIKTIGDVLEISDTDNFDLNDNLLQKVLNGSSNPDGTSKPMNLYDVQLAARKDERWKYTETAHNEYTSIASKILKDFGFGG